MLPEDWQTRHLRSAESIAGPRFDSVLDVDLDFASVFDGLGRTQRYRDSLAAIGNRLDAVFTSDIGEDAPEELKGFVETSRVVSRGLLEASAASPTAFIDTGGVLEAGRRGLDLASDLRDKYGRRTDGSTSLISDYVLHRVNKAAEYIRDAHELVEARPTRAADRQFMLLTGPAGSGKTHLLLHVAHERASRGLATIVLFGDRFTGLDHPRDFGARLGLDKRYTLQEMLDELEEVGRTSGTRSLLLIDAVNETTPCEIWRDGLPWLDGLLSEHPHVCVVASVRDGFESAVAVPDFLARTLRFEHPGFAQNLWDAVKSFFAHYRVQWPEVPLLGPEFANPLFLKLFCVAFSGDRPRSFRGHQGGTHVFEAYAKKVGPDISQELGHLEAAPNCVWTDLIKPLATWMGERGTDEIPIEDAGAIAETAFPGRGADALVSAENHALLVKSPRFARSGEVDRYVLRFSYQKFSDHLIVRSLLNRHFEPASSELEVAFEPETRLGRIAYLQEGQGLLEALAAQVPERTNGQHELTDFVPEEIAKSWQMSDAFLDSLVWRKPEAISERALDYILDVIFGDLRLVRNLFEVLLSVASVPGYRLNGKALHKLLTGWSLPERDQWWTDWLRYQYVDEGTAVDRLVSWARRAPGRDHVNPEAALLTSIALSWLFTSTNRFLRDDATKAAVSLLEHHPAVVPELLALFESVDDPYVVERVFCAALGALTRNPQTEALATSSRLLLDGFFARGDNTHILTRDYARGIVELAVKAAAIGEEEAAAARPPYGAAFPEKVPSKEDLKAKYADDEGHVREYGSIWHSVMEWDFGWYIIGTNSGSTPWSNRRFGESPPPTLEDRWRQFEGGLFGSAREAYDNWQQSNGVSIALWIAALQGASDGDRDHEEPQEPIREAELRALLTPQQTVEFEALLSMKGEPIRDDTFDLRIEQSWVFLRCLELGWTKERFGDVDGQHSYGRDGSRKTERIGKKYQWIAHYEFLGLVADNFELKPAWGQTESTDYHGPWLDYLRDIDPTCLADGLVHLTRPRWCDLPPYDPDAMSCEHTRWLATIDDLPDPVRVLELADGDEEVWLSLKGSHEWRHPPAPGVEGYEVAHRRVWYELQAYVLRAREVDAFIAWADNKEFMGRWMPENREFSEVYLREFPHSAAFADLAAESGPERTGWVTDARGGELDISLQVATDTYGGSSTDRDCSVKESFTVRLPSAALVRGMRLSHDAHDGTWKSGDVVVALDPSVDADSARRLVMRRSYLERYLSEEGLAVVWTLMAAKELLGGRREDRYRRTEVSGAYALGPEGVSGRMWVTHDE